MTEQLNGSGDLSKTVSELTKHLNAAVELLERQAQSVGDDLEAESQNLRDLVADKDETTQSQIGMLCQSVAEMDQSLSSIRQHLLVSLSAASQIEGELGGPSAVHCMGETSESSEEVSVSAKEAGSLRHDEPVTLMSALRSLLMADEAGQRERRGALRDGDE